MYQDISKLQPAIINFLDNICNLPNIIKSDLRRYIVGSTTFNENEAITLLEKYLYSNGSIAFIPVLHTLHFLANIISSQQLINKFQELTDDLVLKTFAEFQINTYLFLLVQELEQRQTERHAFECGVRLIYNDIKNYFNLSTEKSSIYASALRYLLREIEPLLETSPTFFQLLGCLNRYLNYLLDHNFQRKSLLSSLIQQMLAPNTISINSIDMACDISKYLIHICRDSHRVNPYKEIYNSYRYDTQKLFYLLSSFVENFELPQPIKSRYSHKTWDNTEKFLNIVIEFITELELTNIRDNNEQLSVLQGMKSLMSEVIKEQAKDKHFEFSRHLPRNSIFKSTLIPPVLQGETDKRNQRKTVDGQTRPGL
jgi:hypothetical protein